MAPTVSDNHDASRYEIFEGDDLAGFVDYHRNGDRISLNHTEVDDAFEGKGIGSALARGVLDAQRESGVAVLPFCPFLADYIKKHPDDYAGLVPEDRRADFGL